MDNLITISNQKENVLEFNVMINGVDTEDTSVRFIIESSEMDLAFDSEKGKEKDLWSVKIPPLSILETTTYPFRIDVIVDGYHFSAMNGSLNVVGSHDIYVTKPENITLNPAKKRKKVKEIIKKAEPKEEPVVLAPKKTEKIKVEKPVEPVVKPNRKFEMTPLRVEDGKKLFKTLTNVKKPKRKTDDKLDDKIIELMKKAKTEVKKEEPKKVEVESTKKEVKKEAKKVIKKEAKQPVKKDDVVKDKKSTNKPVKETMSAKNIAKKLIQSVTGLGIKEDTTNKNSKDDKIKEIITEDNNSKNALPAKKEEHKEATGIKKITKDNTIVEVDKVKEQDIKTILNEVKNSNNKNVTTKPFKKEKITIH